MKTIYLATNNDHKIREFQSLVLSLQVNLRPSSELGDKIDWQETGTTFRSNALIKAKRIRQRTSKAVLADDSGLCVDYLEGRPGVFSSRFAGLHASDAENIGKLLAELKGVPVEHRTASFVCVLAFIDSDGSEWFFEGKCSGNISDQRTGNDGFGYDPIFYLPKYGKTMAELRPAEKNQISHRGQAVELWLDWYKRRKI